MGHILSHPVTSKFLQRAGSVDYRCGVCEMQGYRVNMEDAHNMILSLDESSHPDVSFFAVYDGHSGGEASIYMAANFPSKLAQLKSEQLMEAECLKQATIAADLDFMKNLQHRMHGTTACFAIVKPVNQTADDKKSNKPKVETPSNQSSSASTSSSPTPESTSSSSSSFSSSSSSSSSSASSSSSFSSPSAKRRYRVIVSNVGDSRFLHLSPSGAILFSTIDHKPDDPVESRRIRAAGGSVSYGRVDGELAMSRSIGDYNYKAHPSLSPTEQKVIAEPDIKSFEVEEGDRILIMCDGLVEKMTNEQVVTLLETELQKQIQEAVRAGKLTVAASGSRSPETLRFVDPAAVVSALCDHSLNRGSKDNMSAMLILLTDGRDLVASKGTDEFIAGPYAEGEDDRKFVEAYHLDGRRHGIGLNKLMALARERDARREKEAQMDDS